MPGTWLLPKDAHQRSNSEDKRAHHGSHPSSRIKVPLDSADPGRTCLQEKDEFIRTIYRQRRKDRYAEAAARKSCKHRSALQRTDCKHHRQEIKRSRVKPRNMVDCVGKGCSTDREKQTERGRGEQ